MSKHERLDYLYRRYTEAVATEEELKELFVLSEDRQHEPRFMELMNLTWVELEVTDRMVYRVMPKKVVPLYKRTWYRIAAAAVILFAIALGVVYTTNNEKPNDIAGTNPEFRQDISAPQSNRATITLANGQQVFLDSARIGTLISQGNVNVTKTADGQVVYSGNSSEMAYNTLFNPRGSKVITLTLSDGTKVWLNSESSLKYPVAFAGDERKVEITGEAYFEVAHNKAMPFFVRKAPSPKQRAGGEVFEIQVLGTSFNVNSYEDEGSIKVTLLEGSVRISDRTTNNDQRATILKPGQQASVTLRLSKGEAITVTNPDIDQVMAWKNGNFKFGGSDVESVMKQLSRWYDVEIVYEGQKPVANFRGTISRQNNISEVLKMLQLTKAVKFRVENNRVIVTK